jgi:hypothetical protein
VLDLADFNRKGPAMSKHTDLGKTNPVRHPSGRVWEPPVSVEQARARVLHEMKHLEENCRIGLDAAYALRCLDEAIDDYTQIVLGE